LLGHAPPPAAALGTGTDTTSHGTLADIGQKLESIDTLVSSFSFGQCSAAIESGQAKLTQAIAGVRHTTAVVRRHNPLIEAGGSVLLLGWVRFEEGVEAGVNFLQRMLFFSVSDFFF